MYGGNEEVYFVEGAFHDDDGRVEVTARSRDDRSRTEKENNLGVPSA